MPRRPSIALRALALAGACLTMLACEGLPPEADASSVPHLLAATGEQIVTVDPHTDELVAITVADGAVTLIRRVALSGAATRLVDLGDGAGVLALCRDDETLDRVDLPSGAHTTYALGAPFEALAVAPDASTAIAYFPPGTASAVFHNASELALVDLRAEIDPAEAVTRRTIASLGGAPRSVHPSPMVAGRRFAVILSDQHVGVLDLLDPDAPERSIPLVSLATGGQRTPLDVAFAVEGPDLWAIITTAEGTSVYALRISDAADQGPGLPTFDVRLTQLAGFASGGQVTVLPLPGGQLVAIILNPALGTATVTELTTSVSQSLTMELGINRIHTYLDGDRPIAVIFRSGSRSFHVLDVAALQDKKDKALRTRTASRSIQGVLHIPDTPLFVAFHNDPNEAVTVLNTATDRVTSFGRTGLVRAVSLSETLGHLYLLTRLGSADYLVSVRLDNLHPRSALVPGGADALLVLPEAGTVAAARDTPGGHLVLWPYDDTTSDAAVAVPGFLLEGVLDRAAR